MPRAGPLRAIKNPSNAYKATSASRSPEFSACTKSLWRSSGDVAEFTCCPHAVLTSRLLTRHALHSLVLLAEVIRYIFLTRLPYPTSPVQTCPPEQQWRAARLCRSG